MTCYGKLNLAVPELNSNVFLARRSYRDFDGLACLRIFGNWIWDTNGVSK